MSNKTKVTRSRPRIITLLRQQSQEADVERGRLARIFERTAIARFWFGSEFVEGHSRAPAWDGDGAVAQERRRRSALVVRLAAQLYRRERDRFPATPGELPGPYLNELQEGIAPGDPIPTGVE
jgi:hypothetical protein